MKVQIKKLISSVLAFAMTASLFTTNFVSAEPIQTVDDIRTGIWSGLKYSFKNPTVQSNNGGLYYWDGYGNRLGNKVVLNLETLQKNPEWIENAQMTVRFQVMGKYETDITGLEQDFAVIKSSLPTDSEGNYISYANLTKETIVVSGSEFLPTVEAAGENLKPVKHLFEKNVDKNGVFDVTFDATDWVKAQLTDGDATNDMLSFAIWNEKELVDNDQDKARVNVQINSMWLKTTYADRAVVELENIKKAIANEDKTDLLGYIEPVIGTDSVESKRFSVLDDSQKTLVYEALETAADEDSFTYDVFVETVKSSINSVYEAGFIAGIKAAAEGAKTGDSASISKFAGYLREGYKYKDYVFAKFEIINDKTSVYDAAITAADAGGATYQTVLKAVQTEIEAVLAEREQVQTVPSITSYLKSGLTYNVGDAAPVIKASNDNMYYWTGSGTVRTGNKVVLNLETLQQNPEWIENAQMTVKFQVLGKYEDDLTGLEQDFAVIKSPLPGKSFADLSAVANSLKTQEIVVSGSEFLPTVEAAGVNLKPVKYVFEKNVNNNGFFEVTFDATDWVKAQLTDGDATNDMLSFAIWNEKELIHNDRDKARVNVSINSMWLETTYADRAVVELENIKKAIVDKDKTDLLGYIESVTGVGSVESKRFSILDDSQKTLVYDALETAAAEDSFTYDIFVETVKSSINSVYEAGFIAGIKAAAEGAKTGDSASISKFADYLREGYKYKDYVFAKFEIINDKTSVYDAAITAAEAEDATYQTVLKAVQTEIEAVLAEREQVQTVPSITSYLKYGLKYSFKNPTVQSNNGGLYYWDGYGNRLGNKVVLNLETLQKNPEWIENAQMTVKFQVLGKYEDDLTGLEQDFAVIKSPLPNKSFAELSAGATSLTTQEIVVSGSEFLPTVEAAGVNLKPVKYVFEKNVDKNGFFEVTFDATDWVKAQLTDGDATNDMLSFAIWNEKELTLDNQDRARVNVQINSMWLDTTYITEEKFVENVKNAQDIESYVTFVLTDINKAVWETMSDEQKETVMTIAREEEYETFALFTTLINAAVKQYRKYEVELDDITLTDTTYSVNIKNNENAENAIYVLAAAYGENDEMLAVKSFDKSTISALVEEIFTFDFVGVSGVETVKVFCWKDSTTIEPYCDAKVK